MDQNIYRYIWRHSSGQQIWLLFVTVLTFPVLYFSLDLPKVIVNEAIGGQDPYFLTVPFTDITIDFDQITFLIVLSLLFLLMVVINGGIKYYLNVSQGRLGEQLLRRLRYTLYGRILRFPLPHFRKVSQGEIIPMITSEVEPLGGFMGAAIITPAFQGGYLLTLIGFMMIQDWMLGVLAISLYPIQMYLIPKLQARVNQLAKRRVRTVRKLADRIGETIAGVGEVHAHDTSALERTDISDRLGTIYEIRYEIFRRKYFIKFLNNFIAQLTPFFFYSVGGYLVINGDLTFGALVAVLAAYKDLSGPWKELLAFYQLQADSRIKYEQVIEQFDPPGLMDEAQQEAPAEDAPPLSGPITLSNTGLADEDGSPRIQAVSATLPMDKHVAVVGDGASGKDDLALLVARLLAPTSGSLSFGDQPAATIPEAIIGRDIGYVGPSAYLFAASVAENLTYGLRHRPNAGAEASADDDRKAWLAEAMHAGNSPYDSELDWIDYAAAGVEDREGLIEAALEILRAVELEQDIYKFGLRGHIDPERQADIASNILDARAALRDTLAEHPDDGALVERFDRDSYNSNASVAENLLFGNPVGDAIDVDRVANHEYVRWVLDKADLTGTFLNMGRQVAETMVELFADLPPGHEFFEQFSFIQSDDLPEFQSILNRVGRGSLEELQDEDRDRLLSLPFKIIPARHRLGLIDETIETKLVAARKLFHDNLPADLNGRIAFYAPDEYNAPASIQDNILFGKIAYGQPEAEQRIGTLVGEVLDARDLRKSVMRVGTTYQAGVAGARLSSVQRQKVAIARSLLKRPKLLILNQATSALDGPTHTRLMENLIKLREDQGMLWVLHRPGHAMYFQHVMVMSGGRLIESGSYEDLSGEGSALNDLIASE